MIFYMRKVCKQIFWFSLNNIDKSENGQLKRLYGISRQSVKAFMFNRGSSSSLTICPIDKKMSSYLPNSQNRKYKVATPDTIWQNLNERLLGPSFIILHWNYGEIPPPAIYRVTNVLPNGYTFINSPFIWTYDKFTISLIKTWKTKNYWLHNRVKIFSVICSKSPPVK